MAMYTRKERKEWYDEYLKSTHWHKLRFQRLEKANYTCEICGSKEKLQVHHLAYFQLYNCCVDDVQVVCQKCHILMHKKPKYKVFPKKKKNSYVKKLIEKYRKLSSKK